MKKFLIINVLAILSLFPVCAKSSGNVFFDIKDYDSRGNVVFEKWDDNTEIEYFYDSNGNWIGRKESNGVTSSCLKENETTIVETYNNGLTRIYSYTDNDCKNVKSEISYFDNPANLALTAYYFDDNGLETMYVYISFSGKRTDYWNFYNEQNQLVRRVSSEGDEYYFEYTTTPEGNKRRIGYVERNTYKNNMDLVETLNKINSDYWPFVLNEQELIVRPICKYKNITVYESQLIWGESKRMTSRLIFFNGKKYAGNLCGIYFDKVRVLDGVILFPDFDEEYGNKINLSDGVPKQVYINGENIPLTK